MNLSFLCPRCRTLLKGLECSLCGFAATVEGGSYDFVAKDPACEYLADEISFWDQNVTTFETWRLKPKYESLSEYFSGSSFHRSARRMLPELRDLNLIGKVAMEVGGTGHGLAMMIASGCRQMYHLEVSRRSQELAQESLATRVKDAQAEITFLRAPAEKIPLPDASIDWLMAFGTYHHTDRTRSVAEIFRVLKPGGSFYFHEAWIGTMLLPIKWLTRIIRKPFGFFPGKDDPLHRKDLRILKTYFPYHRYAIRNVLDAPAFIVRYILPRLGARMYKAEIDLPGVTTVALDFLKGVLLFSGKKTAG